MKSYLLTHYLTVAIRSLERYKTQSVISIVGLAVGFVCLSLSALWLRYDNTYNTSIPDYKNLYAIGAVFSGNFLSFAPGGLITTMDEWPEVEAKGKYTILTAYVDGDAEQRKSLIAHTSLFDILPFDIVQGDPTFSAHLDEQSVVLTDEYARECFGTEDPVGQKLIVDGEEKTVVAVVRAFGPHTTFQFDFIEGMHDYYYTLPAAYMSVLVRLCPGDDVRASFEQKIAEYRPYETSEPIQGRLIPLNELHQYDRQKKLSYAHMRAFLLVSVLLTACALINFLTLYLNRLRGRKREMALRLVHGSSHRGLVAMFATELLVTLGSAIVLGMLGVFALKEWQLKYADEMMKEMTESDQNLGHLLLLVTLVAILIAVFGVYSIITLACRQRRKEIALRKIHGAKLKDILGMFVNEYGLILVISSAVAFAVGYLIMHGWLEQYVRRIIVGPLFYIGIFVATALLIALSVGTRVWRTARENPADVIKSE